MIGRGHDGICGGRLLCLSAFSGIGGLDLGLEYAGFSTIGTIEIDPSARRTLALNRPWLPCLDPHDINDVARTHCPSDLGIQAGELALLAAGPPCQPFSKAAQWSRNGALGLGSEDARSCLDGLIALLERFLPHTLLIENVPGFARGDLSVLSALKARFGDVNRRHGTRYRPASRVIDAVEYGVPQRRRRAIVIALRNGEEPAWPAPTHRDCPVRAWDALRDVRPRTVLSPSGRFAGLLPSIPEGENYQYLTERGDGPALFGYRRRFWSFLLKLAKARPAWTVPANPGPSTGPFHWESRPLAPEEVLRLQTFPVSWKLEGHHRAQIRQAGNATPPLLAEVLGRTIASRLLGVSFREPPALAVPRTEHIPPPELPKPVAAEYMSLVGSHAPHPGAGLGPRPRGGGASASSGPGETG